MRIELSWIQHNTHKKVIYGLGRIYLPYRCRFVYLHEMQVVITSSYLFFNVFYSIENVLNKEKNKLTEASIFGYEVYNETHVTPRHPLHLCCRKVSVLELGMKPVFNL